MDPMEPTFSNIRILSKVAFGVAAYMEISPKPPAKPTPALWLIYPPLDKEYFTTFRPFPFLPTELRKKIWYHALEPRVLHLEYDISEEADLNWEAYGMQQPYCGRWILNNMEMFKSPMLLRVCQESRAEIWHHRYELVYGRSKPFWFSPKIDSIFLDTNATWEAKYVEFYGPPVFGGTMTMDGILSNARDVTLREALWTEWDFGSFDENKELVKRKFKRWKEDFILAMESLKRLRVVGNGIEPAATRVVEVEDCNDLVRVQEVVADVEKEFTRVLKKTKGRRMPRIEFVEEVEEA